MSVHNNVTTASRIAEDDTVIDGKRTDLDERSEKSLKCGRVQAHQESCIPLFLVQRAQSGYVGLVSQRWLAPYCDI